MLIKVGHSTSLLFVGAEHILRSDESEVWGDYRASKIHFGLISVQLAVVCRMFTLTL